MCQDVLGLQSTNIYVQSAERGDRGVNKMLSLDKAYILLKNRDYKQVNT